MSESKPILDTKYILLSKIGDGLTAEVYITKNIQNNQISATKITPHPTLNNIKNSLNKNENKDDDNKEKKDEFVDNDDLDEEQQIQV